MPQVEAVADQAGGNKNAAAEYAVQDIGFADGRQQQRCTGRGRGQDFRDLQRGLLSVGGREVRLRAYGD